MSHLKPAAQRVQDTLRAKGLDAEVRHMPASTRTAQEAALACGCGAGQIVKSLIFRGTRSGTAYLLLVSGTNRVDEKIAETQVGEPLGRADAEFVRQATGFAIGGIPPLGHASAITTFIDEALLGYDVVWAAAGTPDAVFPIAPARLAEAVGAKTIRVIPDPAAGS